MNFLKIISLSFLILGLGCSTEMHLKVKLDIPAYSPLKIEEFKELILVPFYPVTDSTSLSPQTKKASPEKGEQAPPEESSTEKKSAFDVPKELTKYFLNEFSRRFKGTIRSDTRASASPEALRSPEYWSSLFNNSSAGLIFTGQVRFQEEIRKAILYRPDLYRADQSEEELFAPQKKLGTRHVFTLELHVVLIKASTGEVIFERDFKETKMTPDLNYPPHFALYELMQRIKLILFRQIFGEERLQERYLLIK